MGTARSQFSNRDNPSLVQQFETWGGYPEFIAIREGSLAWTAWVPRTVSTSLKKRSFAGARQPHTDRVCWPGMARPENSCNQSTSRKLVSTQENETTITELLAAEQMRLAARTLIVNFAP